MDLTGKFADRYQLQELENLIGMWLICDKVRLKEIPQEIRVWSRTYYTMARRRVIGLKDVDRYVEELRLIVEDVDYVEEFAPVEARYLVKILWDWMYIGEDYFEGVACFDEFVLEQKKERGDLFSAYRMPFPNQYAL